MTSRSDDDRSSLRFRVGVLGLVFLALVVFAVGLSGLMVRSWTRTVDARAELRKAAIEVADLRFAYSEQKAAIRDYLLDGESASLAPYEDGVLLARATVRQLRANTAADEIGIDSMLDDVEAAAADWHAAVAEPALADPSRPPDEAAAAETSRRLRAEVDRLDDDVTAELDRLVARTDDVKSNTFGVLVASAIAAFVAIMLVAVLFRRWVIRPLAQIGSSARALSAHDAQQLPDFDSAELQDVVDAIRTLQESLAHERDRAITAYRALEQSAVLALHVRSELADELGEPPPGWAVGSALQPAEGVVAGDCFDLGLLDQHRMYVVMVDVTGHGAASALDALKSKSQLRAALRSRVSPGGALDWLSRENRKDERANMLTAVVAVIEIETGHCQYANAGHPAPLLTNGEETIELGRTGPLLGAFESTWRTDSVTIEPGWNLLLYTDGVTEALGADRQRFGEQRVAQCLEGATMSDPKALVAELLSDVGKFQVGTRTDDVTLVAIHRAGHVPEDDLALSAVDTVQP